MLKLKKIASTIALVCCAITSMGFNFSPYQMETTNLCYGADDNTDDVRLKTNCGGEIVSIEAMEDDNANNHHPEDGQDTEDNYEY